MSAPAFTPGPWRVEEGTTLVWGACNPDDRSTYGMGYPVTQARVLLGAATEYASEHREDEAEANARLIAAAPELYEAAREFQLLTQERLNRQMQAQVNDRAANAYWATVQEWERAERRLVEALAKARGEQ